MQSVGVYDSNGNFAIISIEGDTGNLPPGYYNSPNEAYVARHGAATPAPVYVPPPPPPPTQTRLSPAFDINGNLVTIDLLGGDYVNLPTGYYATPGQAAVARQVEQNTGTPATAQDVGEIYSDPSATAQAAVQQIVNAPPPPSNYQAPEPPVSTGWVAGPTTPPPTSEQLIAQMYVDNGYTPPPAAVLTAIATGQVVAPLTDPLPVNPPPVNAPPVTPPPVNAPSSEVGGVDNSATPAQTAAQLPSTMTGIHPDTAAFVVGQHSSGNPIMELVDANDNLVQWVPGVGAQFIVAPFYVTAAPAVNEKRLIGGDDDGNPVFQLIDTAGTLVQWTENRGQTGYVTAPFAVSTGHLPGQSPSGGSTAASSQNSGGNTTTVTHTTQDLSQPTRQVGQTTKGFPIYQLKDSAGTVKQWIIDPSNPNVILDLVNAPTLGAVYHDSVTDAAVQAAGGGTVQNSGGGNSTTTTATRSQYFDPTHRSIGWDAQGKENFIQVDEAGRIIGYASDGTNLRDLGAATTNATAIAAMLLAQNPYKTNPLTGSGNTTPPINNPTGSTMTTGTAKSSTAVLFLALGAGALWLWNSRRER